MADTSPVSLRIPTDLLKDIDKQALLERRERSNLIRILLEDALAARKKQVKGEGKK
jgi:metal-responsive CopG/Arc/MetJ family transcriptional regulator